jgi:DNA-binding CsgD family transcriptional regulator
LGDREAAPEHLADRVGVAAVFLTPRGYPLPGVCSYHRNVHVEDTTLADPTLLLTHREHEVLFLASRGLTNSQIASELGVSTHVVKFHLASIYRKLGVVNRTEAAAHYVAALAGSADGGAS